VAIGVKTGGRQKGVKNKIPAQAKENIASVFSAIGGKAAMSKWARENPTEYYKIYARLIPVEQHVSGALGSYEAIPVEQREPIPVSIINADSGSTARH